MTLIAPESINCKAVVTADKKTRYSVQYANRAIQEKKFSDFEDVYEKMKKVLGETVPSPPKKKLLSNDGKLPDKRRVWILQFTAICLEQHADNEIVRRFFDIPEDMDGEADSNKETARPDHFDILQTIGAGTFGQVYQVRHKANGTIYAMKVLKKQHVRRKNEVKHVMTERNVLKHNLKHPLLVGLHFSFQTKDKLYFILDYVNGGELFHLLQKEKHFDERKTRFFSACIVCALAYLHENNIIYRDLKPENLMIDRNGYVLLTDFGLCKEGMSPSTKTQTFAGTPEYFAPEIVLRSPYNRTVDWWTLGCVIYEMLYSIPPFYSSSQVEMFEQIVNQPVEFRHPVSEESSDLIRKLLQKEPAKRIGANGGGDVKKHPFFAEIDFLKLERMQLTAPYLPPVKDDNDASQFDEQFSQMRINKSSFENSRRVCDEFRGFTFVEKNNVLAKS